MPAPTPIQIRYGPSGLLGQAVSLAASRGAQQDQDWQFINSMIGHKNRTDELTMDDALQSHRLQLAHSYRVSQEQSPDQSYYSGASNPGAGDAANTALKNTYLNSAAADLPDDQKSQLATLMSNRNITPEQFRGVLFDATKKAKDKTDEDTELTSRRNFVKAATQGLSPEDAATLSSMAEDKKVSTAQLRTAVDSIRGRNAVEQRHGVNLQAQSIDMQAHKSKNDMDTLARVLAKLGVNPEGPSAGLNPTYADANASTIRTMGVGQSIKDSPLWPGSGSLVSGGQSPDVMQQVIAYAKAKRQYSDLLAQRQALVSGGGGGGQSAAPATDAAAPAPASGGTLSMGEGGWPVASDQGQGVSIQSAGTVKHVTPEIAAQFLQLARGDKNAARQMAAQQGYSF